MICKLFRMLDVGEDDILDCEEWFHFVRLHGYDDSCREWLAEYAKLCKEYGRTPREGASLDMLTLLVNDQKRSDGKIREYIYSFSRKQAHIEASSRRGHTRSPTPNTNKSSRRGRDNNGSRTPRKATVATRAATAMRVRS